MLFPPELLADTELGAESAAKTLNVKPKPKDNRNKNAEHFRVSKI
jgi:hypothetical protein